MHPPEEIYKVAVFVPKKYLGSMMDALDPLVTPVYPGYSRVFNYSPVKGTWRSEEGSTPFDGEIGKITVADEYKLEFVCRFDDLAHVVSKISEIHPYEEPAVDVVKQIAWKSLFV